VSVPSVVARDCCRAGAPCFAGTPRSGAWSPSSKAYQISRDPGKAKVAHRRGLMKICHSRTRHEPLRDGARRACQLLRPSSTHDRRRWATRPAETAAARDKGWLAGRPIAPMSSMVRPLETYRGGTESRRAWMSWSGQSVSVVLIRCTRKFSAAGIVPLSKTRSTMTQGMLTRVC
jgi:hypothetical protein